MYTWEQVWQSKSRSYSPFVYENHRASKSSPVYYQSYLSADYFHTIIPCTVLSTNILKILTNISEKKKLGLSLQVDRMSSLLYIRKLTTFQQLDFTNGETASVFLQLHIWLSLLLRGAEAGSPQEHSPREPCSPLGPATAARLRGTQVPQAPGTLHFNSICKTTLPASVCEGKYSNTCLGLLCWSIWCGDFSVFTPRHDCSRTSENV